MPIGLHLIGIAGPSCSGKSEIARRLIRQFSETTSVVLSLDAYYRDLSSMDSLERDKQNFDIPEALDHALFRQHLLALAEGHHVEKPVYDFNTHTRLPQSETVFPGDLVVVEGLFALYWSEIRDLFHMRVFVELNDHVCLSRRIERDTKQRGRTRSSVLAQYNETVKPMNEKYVLPTRSFADVWVNGEGPLDRSVAHIMNHLSLNASKTGDQR